MIDDAGKTRVEEAVRAAEERSTGEIVPALVARSAAYADVRLRGALLASVIATALVALGWRHTELGWLILAQAIAFALGYAVSGLPAVLRALVGQVALSRAVHERAMRAFLEHGLAHTANQTGVLVFASWLERQVVILGDQAIDRKMGQEEWRRAVEALVAGLRRGAIADGFCDAIALIGQKLAEHFPTENQGGPNELPNRLRVDDA
jgi:putative membrane protein